MERYREYKSINAGWVGQIPSHWTTNKFNRLSYMKGRIGWQNLRADEFTQEGPYLITGMNFKNGVIRWNEVYHITKERYDEAPEIQLQEGDVLMTKDGTIGKLLFVDHLPGKASLNSHLLVFRPLTPASYHPRFLYHQLDSPVFKHHTELTKTGTTFYGITQEAVGEYYMILPPLEEQRTIAHFLDDKTAQVAQLITQKQQMLTLLQEERAALINHAVTKGLDAAAPVRDSGIEWLGEVPSHWEILPIKRVAHLKYGLGQPPRQMDEGLPIIRATNVFRGEIDEKGMMYVDPDDIPYERDPVLKLNDIIVVRSGAYTADSAIVTEKYVGAIAGYDMVLRPIAVNPQFMAYALLSNYLLINQLYAHRLRAAQPHLNTEELGESFVIKPPRDEQERIVEYLLGKTAHIQATTLTINQEITLLKEYRAALVAEAVTGQIDVRHYKPVSSLTAELVG